MIETKDESEVRKLKEFQKIVEDLKQDETTCLRYLIAREFNLVKAEEMIRHSMAWRKEVRIEDYRSWTVPDVPRNDFVFRVTGVSFNGGPVLYVPLGGWKSRYWIERGKKSDVEHYGFHILETALTRMKELNNKQAVAILCMDKLSFSTVSHMDSLKALYTGFQALEQNYPELVSKLFVCNAPWVFSIAFNFIKPILSPRTLGKLQIHGSDKNKWLPELRELIPEDAVPVEYLDQEKNDYE